jgi:hypothetical protein
MKKYIFVGGLVGFILGIAPFTLMNLPALEYLSLAFLINKIFSYLPPFNDTAMMAGITLIILAPTIMYALIGYIIGHLSHKES